MRYAVQRENAQLVEVWLWIAALLRPSISSVTTAGFSLHSKANMLYSEDCWVGV